MIEHAVVAHPKLVYAQVLARPVAVHLLVTRIEIGERIATGGAAGAHGANSAQEPDARLESEIDRCERSDGAHVLGHQRVRVTELSPRRDHDLVQVAALAHAEHRIFGQLFRDAHAARADDATLRVVNYGRTEHHRLRLVDRLVAHALLGALVLEPVILQAALARLIANRAIYRVIEQQKLLHSGASSIDVRAGLALDDHAFGRGLLARGHELGLLLRQVLLLVGVPGQHIQQHRRATGRRHDLDQAHPAIGRDGKARVPAVVRNVDPRLLRGADDGLTRFEGDLAVV